MTLARYFFKPMLVVLTLISFGAGMAQTSFPLDSVSGLVTYRGIKHVDPLCKKKSMAVVKTWAGKRMVFPPGVFSVIHESKNRLILKALTEVPGPKGLHPISFKLDIMVSRKSIDFRADNFYFEDITVSLEEWIKKYGSSDSERHKKMVEVIGKGIGSHVFLMIEDLKNEINKQ
ncbi:MAG TPA: hypothetical protein DCX54_06020 [Flavobacteriales bacterium]|nr:hypothetical protein [Flavobacteriales bacterium]